MPKIDLSQTNFGKGFSDIFVAPNVKIKREKNSPAMKQQVKIIVTECVSSEPATNLRTIFDERVITIEESRTKN
jgi:hypothetical protein